MLARALLRGMGRAGGASRNLRHFRATALRPAETVAIRFLEPDGTVIEADAPLGEKLVEVALENDVSLECACGGELACSTCHVILPESVYNGLPDKTEEEEDMLDLAWGLEATSRLSCQLEVTKAFEGVEVKVPEDL